jgi:hypothetical protein
MTTMEPAGRLRALYRVLTRGFDGEPAPAGPEPAAPWRGFLLTGAATLALALALVAGRVAWFDAYWLFRAEPPWIEATGGANRLLDRQTRRAKSLQAMTRDYDVALIGSSTVYHGLDPADAEGRAFNLGISAVLADELPLVAAIVASRSGVRRALVGLDYYMFSRGDVPVRLNPALAGATGRWNALVGGLLGEYALTDSRLAEVAGGSDPGSWTRDGYRVTPPLPPDLTRANDATRRRTTVAYRPETLAFLDLALIRLAALRVDVYVAPVSPAQKRVLADKGLLEDFARWREDVARVAGARGVRLIDLADLGSRFPFDPERGSTDHWLDNLHFTPLVGRLVLEEAGLLAPARRGPAT